VVDDVATVSYYALAYRRITPLQGLWVATAQTDERDLLDREGKVVGVRRFEVQPSLLDASLDFRGGVRDRLEHSLEHPALGCFPDLKETSLLGHRGRAGILGHVSLSLSNEVSRRRCREPDISILA